MNNRAISAYILKQKTGLNTNTVEMLIQLNSSITDIHSQCCGKPQHCECID